MYQIGQRVKEKEVWRMVECTSDGRIDDHIAWCGEPQRHINGKPVYATFCRIGDGRWIFCGYCYKGETLEPESKLLLHEQRDEQRMTLREVSTYIAPCRKIRRTAFVL